MDPYLQLGVSRAATPVEITLAYRRLAQRWHPDRNPGDAAASMRFVEIQQAYRILGHSGRRSAWDRQNTTPNESSFKPAQPSWHEKLRPQWAPRPRPPGLPGDHAHIQVSLPLESVMFDQTCILIYPVTMTCPRCLGKHDRCPLCGGTGQRFVTRRLELTVPAGVHQGQVLRVRNQGHDGPRFSQPGDLWVGINWTKPGRWRWKNHRLEARLRRSGTLVRQGGLMKLRAPSGKWGTIQIPPLPKGAWVRVPGLGLPEADGERGAAWIELI